MLLSEPIEKIMPESFEYDQSDPHKRLEYFHQMYQNAGATVEIPCPWIEGEVEAFDVPADEYWLQTAAYHAHIALLDALAGLVALLDTKCKEVDDEEHVAQRDVQPDLS